MRDPYLYEDVDVLKNLLDIKEASVLDCAEADYVSFRLKQLAIKPLDGDYLAKHYLRFHKYIFQDLYEWAGVPRTISIYKEEDVLGGLSIDYSDPFDIKNDLNTALGKMNERAWADMDKGELVNAFCDDLARLWKVHCFREGNTRTAITFCCQFADEKGFPIDRSLFEENSSYVRTALVAYNAVFDDLGDLSKKGYLRQIVSDVIE